jgi:hypothetical protein
MFTQDVSIPGITSVVAKNHADLYAEVLADSAISSRIPALTVASFETTIANKALKQDAEAILVGRKSKVWLKGLYAVSFALQNNSL